MTYSLRELQSSWVKEKGIAPSDFLVLVMHVTNKDRNELFREKDTLLTEAEVQELTDLLERRTQKEPVAYLTGKKEFFGRSFLVTQETLIPRPDSECLIEDLLSFLVNARKPECILDIGTGSGALIITLARELSKAAIHYMASDTSQEALGVAQKNAELHHLNVTFHLGSLLKPYRNILKTENPVYIVANLPYVSEALLKNTEPDVQKYEPVSALLSENEGLAHYQALFKEMQAFSGLHGVCWIEMSPEQAEPLKKTILSTFPESEIFIGQDLSHRNRFIRFIF